MGPSGRFTHVIVILDCWDMLYTGLYLGRAPRTKETLPDFCEKCRVTRHSRVFCGLRGSQRTPGFWGVTIFKTKVFVFNYGQPSDVNSGPTSIIYLVDNPPMYINWADSDD